MKLDTVYQGNCATLLQELEAESIDLTVTSPPYDGLRKYNGYEFDFEAIANGLYRATKPGGVVVWVVGDATVDGSETGTSFKQALYFKECGFRLHDTMIWDKCGTRYPDENRYYSVFEYMFVFSKGKPMTFNPIEDKPNKCAGDTVARRSQIRHVGGELSSNSAWRNDKDKRVKEIGRRFNLWPMKPEALKDFGDHPAVFPEALARDHILSWSNPGDLVLDPFAGSGTTLKMAKETGRHFIGFEISEEYCKIARKRVMGANVPLPLMVSA